jgi:hypothetical protein
MIHSLLGQNLVLFEPQVEYCHGVHFLPLRRYSTQPTRLQALSPYTTTFCTASMNVHLQQDMEKLFNMNTMERVLGVGTQRRVSFWFKTSVACAIGPSVNPLQNRETQHVNIVLQCMYPFFEQPNMKGKSSCLNWMVSLQVLSCS